MNTKRIFPSIKWAVLVAFAFACVGVQAQRHDDPNLKWNPCPPVFPKGCEVAVLHGDPATGASNVFLRIPAGYKFPRHSHTSPEHVVLVAGTLVVRSDGEQRSTTVRTGAFAYIPGKTNHDAQCTRAGRCVLFIAFESPIDAMLADSAK